MTLMRCGCACLKQRTITVYYQACIWLHGCSFTRLTREVHQFAAPFDERFRDLMRDDRACDAVRFPYALRLHTIGRNLVARATPSRPLAASCGSTSHSRREASAKFALLRGAHAAFDCRISQLPNAESVVDYFRWRSAGAHRNALNGHCYWLLRKQGKSTIQTTTALLHLSVAQKNELLFQAGINL